MLTGSTPHGQGHETSWSQIVADRLGYEIDEVEVLHGDTVRRPARDGHVRQPQPRGRRRRALLRGRADRREGEEDRGAPAGVDEAQVEHVRGAFHGPEASLTLKEVAFAAWTAHNLPEGIEPGLEATYVYDPPNFSWPSGAHVAIVEVDTETGAVELLRYVAVDDVGTVVNPMIVEGQIHGGLAQGVAQALYEEAIYDEDGNLLTGNMVTLPRSVGGRVPALGAPPHGDAEPDEPARREGRGGDGRDRVAGGGDERRRRRARRRRHHRHRHARDAGASLACAGGGAAMIPAPFDYEVAESVDHAIALLGDARGREAARGRAFAAAAAAAAVHAAVAARRRRAGSTSCRTCATPATRSRSAR